MKKLDRQIAAAHRRKDRLVGRIASDTLELHQLLVKIGRLLAQRDKAGKNP